MNNFIFRASLIWRPQPVNKNTLDPSAILASPERQKKQFKMTPARQQTVNDNNIDLST